MNHAAIDAEVFAELQELADGDAAFFEELIGTFDAQAEILLAKARAAAKAGETDDFLNIVHALNGSSRNVGAMEFARVCTAIERGQAPVSSLTLMFDMLEEPLRVARVALREYLQPTGKGLD